MKWFRKLFSSSTEFSREISDTELNNGNYTLVLSYEFIFVDPEYQSTDNGIFTIVKNKTNNKYYYCVTGDPYAVKNHKKHQRYAGLLQFILKKEEIEL